MIRTIKKLKIASSFLILFFLNFYFLSPFIHEHPMEIEGQVELENVPHSHLESMINSNLNNGYLSDEADSHTHNFAFKIPIIINSKAKFDNLISSNTFFQKEEYWEELESDFYILSSITLHQENLREKYIHFESNNSPPLNS